MTILNHITLDALVRLPMSEIVALPAAELARLQKEAEDALRKAKLTVAWLNGALSQKYAERAKAARADAGKDFGAVRLTDGDITIVAELDKKVVWDESQLSVLMERIAADGENPRDYVEVSLRVSERRYAAWPPYIRKAFEPARAVKAGRETFELITGDA
jgi:hypothetical protein